VEAGNIKDKKKQRNRRALRGTNSDWAEYRRCALEDEPAMASGEERLNPGKQIGGDPPLGEDTSELGGADIVKTTFDIAEES